MKTAVARMPSPVDDDDDSSSESESSRPQKRQAVATRLAIARRPLADQQEYLDSSDDEMPFPAKRSRSSSFQRRRQPSGKPRKKQKSRRPFTNEEKEAIRAGVDEFGKGNWALIRECSNGVLLSRTNVNIKDAYRTWKIVEKFKIVVRHQ